MISAKQMKSILDYVDIGQQEGASLTTGGERVGKRGYFISPAVFANVEHEMRISQEEIFGPVVSVIKFRDEADALRIANGTAYSLAAGVWSRDMRLPRRDRPRSVIHAVRSCGEVSSSLCCCCTPRWMKRRRSRVLAKS